MEPAKLNWADAVTYARMELTEIFAGLAHINTLLPAKAAELEEQLTKLAELHAKEPPIALKSQEKLEYYLLRRAYNDGLAPSDHILSPSPYVVCVERLISLATSRQIAYQALGTHAATLISDNLGMIPQLRIFVTEILRGKLTKPSARGTPKIHPSRDRMIYALLLEIVDKFGVTPTRAKSST
ncbi:MAG: hypothetical protein U1D06_01460, partial [Paracoccaceae bacterium]|nr:hypothetical protein [Paracoccaceae bacterium]